MMFDTPPSTAFQELKFVNERVNQQSTPGHFLHQPASGHIETIIPPWAQALKNGDSEIDL